VNPVHPSLYEQGEVLYQIAERLTDSFSYLQVDSIQIVDRENPYQMLDPDQKETEVGFDSFGAYMATENFVLLFHNSGERHGEIFTLLPTEHIMKIGHERNGERYGTTPVRLVHESMQIRSHEKRYAHNTGTTSSAQSISSEARAAYCTGHRL